MRHVPIQNLLQTIFADQAGKTAIQRLELAHLTAAGKTGADRETYIDKNGTIKWSPLKNHFTAKLGNKCWYTEAELVGAPLTIDHYRPKCDYWFLAFKPDNYRIACPFANSPKHNPLYGCAGGKGDDFPLLDERNKAHGSNRIKNERPIILDPCNEDDCNLIAFLPDGRPVLNPAVKNDAITVKRLEKSKLLLNLDHPDFNSKREQLRKVIERDVKSHENSSGDPEHQANLRDTLAQRISKAAPFSIAARQYLSAHKHLDWVANLLQPIPI